MLTISNSVERKFIDSIDLCDLEIETDSGWQPVTHIHKTILYSVWVLETESGLTLECADTHIVFDHNLNEIFVRDLKANQSRIITTNGIELVTAVCQKDHSENMFDITVDHPSHRFYSNSILSHNSTLINALSYALYGSALTNIRRDNLINKTNAKGMLVSLEFEVNGVNYKVERGRRPNVLRLFIDHKEFEAGDDNSQGDSRQTQEFITRLLGMSYLLFKHIVAMNTYTEPFLSLGSTGQRQLIEEILGITQLSEKAQVLKDQMRATKDQHTALELTIKAIHEANKRVLEQIESLKKRQKLWDQKQQSDIDAISEAIEKLAHVDITAELAQHDKLAEYVQVTADRGSLESHISRLSKDITRSEASIAKLTAEINDLRDHKCYACGQEFHDSKHTSTLNTKIVALEEAVGALQADTNEHEAHTSALAALPLLERPKTVYSTQAEALKHQHTLDTLVRDFEIKHSEENPYTEQIADMENKALQAVDYEPINQLARLNEHQEFLFKLLTNKDSFIRKKIIEQNLSYLNARLSHYLDVVGLPHTVVFQNDLSVEIADLGRELDFDNLSRGERGRLIISLSFAFRDVWESLFSSVNLLFVDELLDNGIDPVGVEGAMQSLKRMAREGKKSVWLVSHRDELHSRVDNILKVIKENGFTSYTEDE